MNNLLYSLYFGLGVAALVYSRFGRRIGYGNAKNVWMIVTASLLMAMFFAYSFLAWVIHFK